MKTLKLGIIGSGFGLYGLLPAFNSLENCEVIAICGKKTERLLEYCQKIGLNNIYSNWQLMLETEKLDAIAIAVPPGEQYKIAKVAIDKRLNIFAEKPLAANYAQAKQMLNWAKKKKIINAVDFIFPEIDEWRRVKEMIENKEFGGLRYISVNWDFISYDIKNNLSSWKTNVNQGGGALSFYFSHVLYYLEHFGGEILDIRSFLSYSKKSVNGGEVGIDLLMKFKNNVSGYAHLRCDARGFKRHQLIFQFETATVILENKNSLTENFRIIILKEDDSKKIISYGKLRDVKEDERIKEVSKIGKRFVEACINKRQMTPSFKDGLRVQALIKKIRSNN